MCQMLASWSASSSYEHLCNVKFTTQYAFINRHQYIHVSEYDKQQGGCARCSKGHELVLCDGIKIKKYFRHKHSGDVGGAPLSRWHAEMQSYFPVTEHTFPKECEKQLKARRADVYISKHNLVVEIQHSCLTQEEVRARKEDYGLHRQTVVWVLDGNTADVECERLSTGNYRITFSKDWKYTSFRDVYAYVLLDVNGVLFKIAVSKVCNKMILVKEGRPLSDVVDVLQHHPSTIWECWGDDNEVKPMLRIQQKGAGNGKTYGIWKSIAENPDKDLFLIVTKQHSAKTVIHKELMDQMERNEWHIEDNMDIIEPDELKQKKIIVHFKHKHSGRICKVVIATIDSFLWNLTALDLSALEKPHTLNIDYFKSLRRSITHSGMNKVNQHNGQMRFAGGNINLNKKVELWIDEAQDLDEDYVQSVLRVILDTKIDVVVVGDRLQSLEHTKTFLTYEPADFTPHQQRLINIVCDEAVNENRRICVDGMTERTNELVHFGSFGLPPIKLTTSNQNTERFRSSTTDAHNAIETIQMPRIYANDTRNENYAKIMEFIDVILHKVNTGVCQHGYKPNDFLFIFPMMKGNTLACELETKLNEYWIEKCYPSEYTQYAVLHRHEEGQVIDMKQSENASRIVTIRTSKGDGRKVVFVLGCTEKSLRMVSREKEIGIVYESYLHVALTRAKEKMYFGLEANNDDVHQRFGEAGLVEYKPHISMSLSCNKIVENIDHGALIGLLKEHGVKELDKPKTSPQNVKEESHAIDWVYHCIRRAVYMQYAFVNILNHTQDTLQWEQSQIRICLEKMSKLTVCTYSPKGFYEQLNKFADQHKDDIKYEMEYFPLCNMSHKFAATSKNAYTTYCHKLKAIIEQNNFNYLGQPLSILDQTPLQAVVQWYTLDLYRHHKYCEISPMTIYNILHHFEQVDETKLTEFLEESAQIKQTTDNAMETIFKQERTVTWNIGHTVQLQGETTNIKVSLHNLPIVGHSKSCVYHLMFKTDFNALNYWDTMVSIAIERFTLQNPQDKDVSRFQKKDIKTFLFVLKHNKYEVFEWKWDRCASYTSALRTLLCDAIIKHFESFHNPLFNYCTYNLNHPEKWESKFDSAYEYIAKEYSLHTQPEYISKYFTYLHELYTDGDEDRVRRAVCDRSTFCNALKQRLERMCRKFMGVKAQ